MNKLIRSAILKIVSKSDALRRANNIRSQKRYIAQVFPESEILKAESGEAERKRFFDACFAARPQQLQRSQEEVLSFAKRNHLSLDEEIQKDLLFCVLAYGICPEEYFAYRFQEKNPPERRTFYSMRESLIDVYRMNDAIDRTIFSDKINTYARFYDCFGRQAVAVTSPADEEAVLAFLADKTEIVKKDAAGEVGRGVELLPSEVWKGREKTFFRELLQEGRILLEERIHQSGAMACFNDSSVNTVRLISYYTCNGVIVPFCFLKTGRKGSFIDNGGAGGILCGIDPERGVLNTDGYTELGLRFERHPDSGAKFCGTPIPDFQDALVLCKKLSERTPRVKFIGWDFAHTENGWVVVEGNSASQLIGPQTTLQKGLKEEIQAILQSMDLII